MWKTFVRRILILIPQLLILSLLIFILANNMPGDALTGQMDPNVSPARLEELRIKFGFYDPWYVKYGKWITGVVQGDFGISITYKLPVTTIIGQRVSNTFWLSLLTAFLTYLIAIPLGIIAGRRSGGKIDRAIALYGYVALAMPSIIFGLINIFVFAYKLHWFPSGGTQTVGLDPNFFVVALDRLHHMLLPALTSALVSTTGIIFYLRSEIVDYKASDFVLTARSKGVPERVIYNKHVFRNALIPIASFIGSTIAGLISGSIFIESIFTYPGMGKLFIESINGRDYSVVNALVVIFAVLLVLGNLLSDIALTIVDPRIRIR